MANLKRPPALRAVVFDLDGVLANTEDLYEQAGETVLGRRGKTYDRRLREQMMGRPVADAIQIMIDCSLAARSARIDDDGVLGSAESAVGNVARADAGRGTRCSMTLQAANLPVAVATSATRDYADFVLTRLNLKQRFRFILTSEDIRRGKPDPEIYLLAAERLALEPAR